ncbi:MAG TPA: MAPEG family protein [Sphingobium sp.]
MSTELIVLAWGCILGLVHIFAAANAKTKQYGPKWNMGPRDGVLPEPNPLVGRLMRAQANYFETFPLAAAAILIVAVAGLTSRWTAIGAIVWLSARVVYLPLYAAGVPGLRSVVFLIGLAGMLTVLWPALF